jgi:antitoxin VapB
MYYATGMQIPHKSSSHAVFTIRLHIVFVNNRTQAVRLPVDVRLPEGVRKVEIRVRGQERIITPVGQTWDSFFLGGPRVSDDFLPERASQEQAEREAL